MAVSSASEVQIGSVLWSAALFVDPLNTGRRDCFHVHHTLVEFSLCLCSGSPPEQGNQIAVREHFMHIVLKVTEAKCVRRFREQMFDSFNESFPAIGKKDERIG
jgi:hypothetical protein